MSIISLPVSISWGRVDNEIFVINEDTGTVRIFRGIYKDIWILITKKIGYNAIISALKKSTGEPFDRVSDVLNQYLTQLGKIGFINISEVLK